jgi:hypothetical protein
MNTKLLPVLLILLVALPPWLRAQENTPALGRGYSAGDLQGSVNSLGATISATRPATGRHEITIDAPGASAGDGVSGTGCLGWREGQVKSG